MNRSIRTSFTALLALALVACNGKDDETVDDHDHDVDAGAADGGVTQDLAPVCNYMDHSVSFVDLAKLEDGVTRKQLEVKKLALDDYAAPPLSAVEVPGSDLLLISMSPGFFAGSFGGGLIDAHDVPTDPGQLVFFDLSKRKILGELATGAQGMGLAVTPDGARAFLGHFDSGDVSVIDVQKRKLIEQVNVGPLMEELALDDTGVVGVVGYSTAGNARTFATADMSGTLSAPIVLTGDSGGVAFFPGTQIALMVQAASPLTGGKGGYTLIDASDPQAPEVLEDFREDSAPTAYPAAAVPSRKSVVMPVTNDKHALREYELAADHKSAKLVQSIELGKVAQAALFGAYSVRADAHGRVFVTYPRERAVFLVDLETKQVVRTAWGGNNAGPTDFVPLH